MAQHSESILPGTLELLTLKVLSLEPMHGWGIGERIQQMSRDIFSINQGNLYPTLEKMLQRGWITGEWRLTENNRRARYYALTRAGTRQLALATGTWERTSRAVNLILRVT
jgi:PadR family transcriptional regulator PadR